MLVVAVIFLAASVVAVTLFQRLGLGAVLGYLAAGAAIGPSGFGLVANVEEVLGIAELGVVLLLFLIGLELQPSRLWKMRTLVFGYGGAQVAVTAVVIGVAVMAFGLTWQAGLTIGLALAMSSTAIATQILGEKNELATMHGRAAFGILLFQDIAAIPALALVPLLGDGGPQDERHSPLVQIGLVVGVITLLILVGRFLLRRVFRMVAKARSQELSTATALLVVIGTALLVHSVGLSMALGSFLAGVLLADSEYRHELEADIEPFKGLLLGLFFMAVGMSANLRLLLSTPLLIIGLMLGLVALKFVMLYALGRFTGEDNYSASSLGVAVSQGGEFAFVLFSVATGAHVFSDEVSEILVVVVTLSLVTTPLLFVLRDALAKRLTPKIEREFDKIEGDDHNRVIIAGFGRVGQVVGRLLLMKRIPFAALDASSEHIDFVRKFGSQAYYGDASRVDLLRAAKADKAEIFVLAIDDFEASMRTLKVVQENFPHLTIVARARNRQHAYALLGAGVKHVIRENFLGSVETGRVALEELGFSPAEARRAATVFAEYDEDAVRRMYPLRNDQAALIASAKKYATELESIFHEDEREAV